MIGLLAYINQCNTFTPQIKGKCHCINVMLHWLWNVNEIYALYQCVYLIKTFHKSLKLLMAR